MLFRSIGVADPVGLYVNTYGTSHVNETDSEIAQKIAKIFDMRPYSIVKRFGLKNPIFKDTVKYGHFGNEPYTKEVDLYYNRESKKQVEFFAWEKLDYVDIIKKEFGK